MSDWNKIKKSPEYREALREIEELIRQKLKPIQSQLDEMTRAIVDLEKRLSPPKDPPQKP